MEGKILEYEAKTIWREGYREGLQAVLMEEFPDPEEYQEALSRTFTGLIRQGRTIRDATEMTGITEEEADKALAKMLRQREE